MCTILVEKFNKIVATLINFRKFKIVKCHQTSTFFIFKTKNHWILIFSHSRMQYFIFLTYLERKRVKVDRKKWILFFFNVTFGIQKYLGKTEDSILLLYSVV